jgi:hypothetical protein
MRYLGESLGLRRPTGVEGPEAHEQFLERLLSAGPTEPPREEPMEQDAELLLARAYQEVRWEDEEKATNDVEQLREEFRRRLYANGNAASAVETRIAPAAEKK